MLLCAALTTLVLAPVSVALAQCSDVSSTNCGCSPQNCLYILNNEIGCSACGAGCGLSAARCYYCAAGTYGPGGTVGCVTCPDISHCTSTETCTNPVDSQCTQYAAGYRLVEGAKDQCVECSLCGGNTYAVGGCTGGTEDRVCTPCVNCPAGSYRNGCNTFSQGVCTECLAAGLCQPGKYLANCGGSFAGTCTDCASCPGGQYRSGCTGTSAGTCTNCSTCPVG
jgi:hypothetical protein